jgi:hypothetical protein
MLRGLVTASGALRRLGVARPADHIVMLTATPNRNFTALLVKRTPFTVQEVGRVRGWAATSPFFALAAAPGLNERGENLYQSFLTMGTPEREAAFVAAYPFDISAVDDNRPFFFRYSFWRHLFTADPVVRNTSFPFLEHSLLALVMLVGATSIACVYLPLHALARKGMRTPHFGRHTVYFAGAGLGYMACEIALLQRFGLFLGHPNYALSVVLASLLVASGLGSLWSGSIGRRLGAPRFAAYALCVVVLAEYAFALPRLPALVGLPFPAKVAIAAALIAPIGVLLGTFLPRALELLKRENPHLVPWAWGVNGIFSVMAPILSVGFSMSWGINALLLAALPIYLATGWSFVEPVAEPEGSALPAAS